jgi:hypothetical protein
MHFIIKHKQYILPALGVLFIVIVLAYSLEAAFTVLGGIAAVLFGDNQRKRTELEVKTDALKKQESEAAAVRDELERVNTAQRDATEELVAQRESEVDQWLDS